MMQWSEKEMFIQWNSCLWKVHQMHAENVHINEMVLQWNGCTIK